jgi:hypothetical protein
MRFKIIVSIFILEFIVASGMQAILGGSSYFSTIPAIPALAISISWLAWLDALLDILIFFANTIILVLFIAAFQLPNMGMVSAVFGVMDIIVVICLIPLS